MVVPLHAESTLKAPVFLHCIVDVHRPEVDAEARASRRVWHGGVEVSRRENDDATGRADGT
jgi:hypothetical protein